jgi:transposase
VNKKYHIHLTADERRVLEAVVRTGTSPAFTQRHARILLKADRSEDGPAWRDQQIAEAVEVSVATVERVRRLWVTQGRTVALERKKPTGRPRRKLDGAQEAQLAAIACSPPPEGAERWTLALLADKLVELKVVDSIARDTVRVTLKKTSLSLG